MDNFEMHPIFDSPKFLAVIFFSTPIVGPFLVCLMINSIGK